MSLQVTRLFDFLDYQLANYPQENCFVYKEHDLWKNISTEEYNKTANKISRCLLKLGVRPNDKIAVITTNNTPKWLMLDIGILQIGAVNVPLYPTFSDKDYEYILNHSDAKYCFVSDDVLFKKVNRVLDKTSIKKIFSFEEINTAYDWNTFLKEDQENLQIKVNQLKATISPNSLATIIYTSGTTGVPKGVMLSHKNIVSNVFDVAKNIDLHPSHKRVISYLPICHIFERASSYYNQYMGFEIHFAESIDKIGDNIREIRPNYMAVVPRILEKIFDKIIEKGSNLKGIKKTLFFWALNLAEEYQPYGRNGIWYDFKLKIANLLVFKKWRKALGNQLEFMLSGSAPMQTRLIRVFTAANIPVFEGYGMTETSPAISVTNMKERRFKIGTVGKILESLEVKIAEDGEILVKGENVMLGYYKNQELTNNVIKNGFMHTGDIGTIDEDGFLKITDRKKEIFKTSGGKYIAPSIIEAILKKSRFIEQAMVIGESEKMPAALLQLNFDFIKKWAKKNDYIIKNISSDLKIINRIQKEINICNKNLGKWEQIKRFEITPDEWTIIDGHLTPTLKMKRKFILKKYKKLYSNIYNTH